MRDFDTKRSDMSHTPPIAPVITFVQRDGTVVSGTADVSSVMELALELGVRDIEGQCGGFVACGTCHVHVPEEWIARIGRASADEVTMLEYEPSFSPVSRLSCQIALAPDLDGLVVTIPGVDYA
jgi:2Fe-2S ferredoxin